MRQEGRLIPKVKYVRIGSLLACNPTYSAEALLMSKWSDNTCVIRVDEPSARGSRLGRSRSSRKFPPERNFPLSRIQKKKFLLSTATV